MNIKIELLKKYISDFINSKLDDFDAIEKIVLMFEKYNIDCGTRHDF